MTPLTVCGSFSESSDDDPADVEGLQALGHAAAAEDVLDRGRVDVRVALEQPVDDVGAHLVGALLGERALEGAADRGADGVDDHCFGHGEVSLRSSSDRRE